MTLATITNHVIAKLFKRVRSQYSEFDDSTEGAMQKRCHQDWTSVWDTLYLLLLCTFDLKGKPSLKCPCKGLSPSLEDHAIQLVNIALYIFLMPVQQKFAYYCILWLKQDVIGHVEINSTFYSISYGHLG